MSGLQSSKRKPLSVVHSKTNSSILKGVDTSAITIKRSILEGGEPFQISHSEINFVETESDQSYEIQLHIKNVTASSRRIKLLKPKDTRFEISDSKDTPLAPGLSMKISIFFYAKEVSEIHTSLKILSEDYQREVPINVYPPSACFVFEPFLNFGYVRLGKSKTLELEVVNEGSVGSEIAFQCESQQITIAPKKLFLEVKGRSKISVTICPGSVGYKEGFINVLPKQRMLSQIEFSATVIEFSKFVINEEGKEIEDLEIKPLLVGEKTEVAVFIINNTPKSSSFRISQKKGSEIEAVVNTTPEEVGREDTERILYYSPIQGKMEPYSENKILLTIVGKQRSSYQNTFLSFALQDNTNKDLSELEQKWKYSVTFHFDEDQKDQLKLSVGGICLIPRVKLSTNVLEFGQVFVGDQPQKDIEIENFSDSAISVNFPKCNNYCFKPNKFRLQGRSSMAVGVTFNPKKIGELAEVYMIEVGCFNLPLKLFGVGKFNPNYHSQTSLATGRHNSTMDASTVHESRYFDMSRIHISSICEKSMDGANKDQTLRFARKQRLEKKKEHELSKIAEQCKAYDDSKPMDYQFQSKLNATVQQKIPQLDRKKDPLFLDKRLAKMHPKHIVKQNPTSTNVLGTGPAFDPFKEVPEFTSTPKNQNQERTINRQLQPEELREIQVGPTSINIDNIFINSQRQATFHILNNNKQPISVQMICNNEQLAGSSKNLQILPGNSSGGLKLLFKAISVGEFRIPAQYILNGKHFFEFTVCGTVILPCLSVTKTDLKFIFTEEDKEFFKSQKIVLKNTYDYEAKYKWFTVKDGVFEVTPDEGVVGPHSEVQTTIKYHVNNSNKEFQMQSKTDEQKLRLRVINGNDIVLRCSSQVTESFCQCKPLQLNFKDISVCKNAEQRFVVKNTGRAGAVFKIDYPAELEGIIQVSPQKKHLSIDESAEVSVKLSSTKSGAIDSTLTVTIRCGKTITIPIRGNIILPKVSIQQAEVDFGSTPKSGTPAKKTLTLVNQSHIPVELQLNLVSTDHYLYRCLELNTDKIDDNLMVTTTKPKDSKFSKPLIYFLRMAPKCESKLQLSFVPENIVQYNFPLPLTIAGYTESIEGLKRQASCKGILNKLMVEPKEIDFKRVIIQTEKGLCKYQEIRLTNPTEEEIKWWVGTEDISPFNLEQVSGKIKPFTTEVIKVTFYPSTQGQYSKQINFFIDQPQMQLTHCYVSVVVKACSDFPCIIFDRPYVFLPVVPLGVESRCTFQITNDGYENLNLKHIIVQELSNIDISLNYMNGSNLGITKKKIKVEAIFKHDRPLSFTLNIQFYDDSNRVYTLPISGTTDHWMNTIQDYFSTQTTTAELESQCGYLRRYLNSNVCFDKQVGRFPESMLENDLDLFYEVLCFYSSSFQKLRQSKKGPSAQAQFTALDEIIRVLKSEGALLNHIRPELLMNYSDCMTYFKLIENKQRYYQIPWADSEEEYKILNRRIWIITIYQILRTYNTFRNAGNQGKTSKANLLKAAEQSNKLSTEQRSLIAWAEGIYNGHQSRVQTKPLEDFSNLGDCEVLATILQKFTNIKIIDVFGKTGLAKKEIQKRCSKFVQTLANIGVSTHVQPEDIERSSHRQMLLLMEQLFQILPNYLPKSPPIQFNCSLGQSVSKVIEISNPSKHTVSYWAKIEGSKDFQMQSEPSFIIQSKKSIEFKIKYMSHFSSTSSATITFIGKKDNKSIPATMVFSLKGQTVGKVSQKCIQVSCSLYEQIEFNISVVNNLGVDGQFKVQVLPDKTTKTPSFFCFNDKVKVKKSSSSSLSVLFTPVIMETHKCYLFFSDQVAGEFQYEITGLVEMPLISNDILRVSNTVFVDTPAAVELAIPLKNDLLAKARKQIEGIAESKNSKVPKGQLLYPRIAGETYTVELLPVTDMISCAKELSLGYNEEEDLSSTLPTMPKKEDTRKIVVNFNMRMAVKEGVVLMILRNASKTDIRRYKIVLNVVNKPFKYVMEIRTNLFKQVVQPIPMINPTQQPNIYTIHLSQDNRGNFALDCEKQTTVQPGKTEHVNLTFKPKSIGQFTATLKMENTTIGQLIEYDLVGISQQPESVELSFKQNAKQSKTYEIKIPNQTTLTQRYTVKIDLPFATGPAVATVPPLSSQSYHLTIVPRYIGVYTGTLTFEEDGRYLNYKVTIDTRDTLPMREYNLVSKERIPSNLEVEVEEGVWSITYSDQDLQGPTMFTSNAEHNKCKLTYLSGRRAERKAFVYFHNQTKGDLSYLINISVIEAPQVKINPFKAELGKAQTEIIEVENLQAVKVKVSGKSTNPTTFSIQPTTFSIPPKSRFPVKLVYTPSNLQLESADITFESQLGERWKYSASGIGILPTYDEQKFIEGVVNTDTSTFVSFRNPFKEKIQVIISLDKSSAENVFQLIMKNKRVEIEPLGLISIPIVFIPKFNERYETTLNVYMNERMSWKFTIIGTVLTSTDALSKYYKFKCRERKSEVLQLNLPELPKSIPQEYNEWVISLKQVIPANNADLIEKVVSISPQTVNMAAGSRSLNFKIEFMAYKPFEAICIYQISQKNKCRWLSRIEMNCQQPEPDDDILIVSEINNSASVSFKLTNRFKAFTKYNAYFTPESDIELSVSPKTGDLSPYGREGTLFTLTFSPIEYRKTRLGKLIIETQDSFWSYNVKGVLPHYSPPKGVSLVASRIH